MYEVTGKSEPIKGNVGTPFDDSTIFFTSATGIHQIVCYSGKAVDGLSIVYRDGQTARHGKSAHAEKTNVLFLDEDEYVTQVRTRADSHRLWRVEFYTSKSKSLISGVTGNRSHEVRHRLDNFHSNWNEHALVYMFGRTNNDGQVHELGFAWGPPPSTVKDDVDPGPQLQAPGSGPMDDRYDVPLYRLYSMGEVGKNNRRKVVSARNPDVGLSSIVLAEEKQDGSDLESQWLLQPVSLTDGGSGPLQLVNAHAASHGKYALCLAGSTIPFSPPNSGPMVTLDVAGNPATTVPMHTLWDMTSTKDGSVALCCMYSFPKKVLTKRSVSEHLTTESELDDPDPQRTEQRFLLAQQFAPSDPFIIAVHKVIEDGSFSQMYCECAQSISDECHEECKKRCADPSWLEKLKANMVSPLQGAVSEVSEGTAHNTAPANIFLAARSVHISACDAAVGELALDIIMLLFQLVGLPDGIASKVRESAKKTMGEKVISAAGKYVVELQEAWSHSVSRAANVLLKAMKELPAVIGVKALLKAVSSHMSYWDYLSLGAYFIGLLLAFFSTGGVALIGRLISMFALILDLVLDAGRAQKTCNW